MHQINLKTIYRVLYQAFGPQGWWPLYNDKTGRIEYHLNDYSFPKNEQQSFEIILGAILTQNTSWKNVEKALEHLKECNLLKKERITSLSTQELAVHIRSSGYHNQKARKIKEFLEFSGEITRNSLLSIWGIGPETADSILLYACKQPIFVVDAYTKRIMERIGLKFKSYDDLQRIFMDSIKPDYKVYNEFHALLVELGKKICKKQPLCQQCPINKHCDYAKKN